ARVGASIPARASDLRGRAGNTRHYARGAVFRRRLSHDCCSGRGMRPLLNPSRRPIKSVCKCVYGTVARVVYSRLLADWTKPQPGRLNKSPRATHAFANPHCPHCMLAGALLAGAALMALSAGGATGCSKSDTTGAGSLSFAQTRPGALTIAPIPFGEMNGR